ncbi:MAG: DNA repair protein RecN [Candidatus Omnitrophota bacterium]
MVSMIAQFTVKNFGLIDHVTIEFCGGLNVFTGETGAGKSLLIDALHYALGTRLNTSQIRDQQKPCVVQAVFELSNHQLNECSALSEYTAESENTLIISREYLPDGRNRNKINGFAVTLAELKDIGNSLVDFHGPHDHQMLLSEDSHINILDRLSKLDEIKDAYDEKHAQYLFLQKKLKEIHILSEGRERELDILTHQIKELEQVPLNDKDYENLQAEHARVNNAEKLYECTSSLISMIDNDETGIGSLISQAFVPLGTLNKIDEGTTRLTDILFKVQEASSLLSSELTNYIEGLSFQPEEANEINKRYDTYYEILKKYGPSLENTRFFHKQAAEKYELLANLEHNDAALRENINTVKEELRQIAEKISLLRKNTAKSLRITIEKELKELGIPHVQFECRVEKTEINASGCDKVTLYISPNAGEPLKPLAEIISSGEAARIMLALKKALCKVDPIPVLIFDEIDAQIGGRLGSITGKKLKELSSGRQVILITHLPQIASFGDFHFKVLKQIKDSRTTTNVSLLEDESRVLELAKMLSGEKQSQIAEKHAHDMLSKARK